MNDKGLFTRLLVSKAKTKGHFVSQGYPCLNTTIEHKILFSEQNYYENMARGNDSHE